MKAKIHPNYKEINVICSCGNKFKTQSTLGRELHVEVCSNATRSTPANRRSWTRPAAWRNSASATARPAPPPRPARPPAKASAKA